MEVSYEDYQEMIQSKAEGIYELKYIYHGDDITTKSEVKQIISQKEQELYFVDMLSHARDEITEEEIERAMLMGLSEEEYTWHIYCNYWGVLIESLESHSIANEYYTIRLRSNIRWLKKIYPNITNLLEVYDRAEKKKRGA